MNTVSILGCGGFIGSHLTRRLLAEGVTVYGLDQSADRITDLRDQPGFHFEQADVMEGDALQKAIAPAETVISLIALCNPSLYTTAPLAVIEMNYLHPVDVAKSCAREGKRLIHFSTSEVYGKTPAALLGENYDIDIHPERVVLSEESSHFILGPVSAQRWNYACAKQLFERTLFAYRQERNLAYTVIRPFNFIGPGMDYIPGVDGWGVPRVVACFMEALLMGKPLKLVEGGGARRVFTYIDDAVEAVWALLNRPQECNGETFNIGNPQNEASVAELAMMMIEAFKNVRPERRNDSFATEYVLAEDFYGSGYDDSDRRLPDISKAQRLLGWEPRVALSETIQKTVTAYCERYAEVGPLQGVR